MKKTARPVWILTGLLVITSLACSFTAWLERGETPAAQTPAAESTSARPQNRDEEPLSSAVPTDLPPLDSPTESAGEFTGGPLTAGIDSLSSYTSTFTMNVDGAKADGSPVAQELRIEQRVDTAQNARAIFVTTTLNGQRQDGSYELYQIKDAAYMLSQAGGAESCLFFSSTSATSLPNSSPSDFLGDFSGVRLVSKGESVNGLLADHYSVSSQTLMSGFGFTKGDVWIDPSTAIVVRTIGEGQVSASTDLLGEEVASGSVLWEYNLTGLNQPVEIALPEACVESAGQSADYPIPENAVDVANYSGFVSFTSPDSMQTVADFYRTQLPAQGWETNETMSTEAVIMIAAGKDDVVINVMITSTGSGTSVVISPES